MAACVVCLITQSGDGLLKARAITKAAFAQGLIMRYHERLNIVFMRDNGPRRSLRVRRSHFYLLLAFFAILPFICAALCLLCWKLWQTNISLQSNVEKFEAEYQQAAARAERLEQLEALLDEESVPGRDLIVRGLAPQKPESVKDKASDVHEEREAEGPGHEEFPVVDSGHVKVSNVVARIMRGNRIRISLDLHNPETDKLLIGDVRAVLVTAQGEEKKLVFMPEDVGTFRINRFKRTVITAHAPAGTNLADSEIVLEVKNEAGETWYRNIFQVRS